MATVGISEYWNGRLERWVSSGIRKSKAEIVEEGLKNIQSRLDLESRELEEAKEFVRKDHEEYPVG